jgi:predicted P-loop ATPase
VHRFRAGEPWYLDQIQEEELTEKREEFQREDLWDHRIENWVNSQDVSGKFWVEGRKLDREVLSAGRVLELAIGIRPCDQRDGQAEKVGRILKKLGWTRFRKRIGGLVLSYLIPPGGNGNEV